MKTLLLSLATLIPAAVHADPRSSANYTQPAEVSDAGGRRTTSATYANDGSVGFVTGISIAAAPAQTAKAGYIGQLYDVTGLALTSDAPEVEETKRLQLAAWQTLDDATFLSVLATDVTWSVQSGPLVNVSAAGKAKADVVYEDTSAVAQAVYAEGTATIGFTVLDTIADNFGTYAGDGLGDDWQVQYFGGNNPLAAPAIDADFDGQSNLFEFTAGLVPTDNASRFNLTIAPVLGQPTQKHVIFSPIIAGRNYTVEFHTSLTDGAWQTLTGTTQSDSGNERTVTDLNATEARKFYRVKVGKP